MTRRHAPNGLAPFVSTLLLSFVLAPPPSVWVLAVAPVANRGAALLDASQLRAAGAPQGAALVLPQPIPPPLLARKVAPLLGLAWDSLQPTYDTTDELGLRHVRFQQVVPFPSGQTAAVRGGDVIVHIGRQGEVYEITGNVADGTSAIQPPTVGRAAAAATTRRAIGNPAGRFGPLMLEVVPSAGGLVLVYCSEVDLTDAPGAAPQLLSVCTAAHGGGEVREKRDVLPTAIGDALKGTGVGFFASSGVDITARVAATGFDLTDPSRGGTFTVDMLNKQGGSGALFTDADNAWGNGSLANRQTVGVDAHYGVAVTWDYYSTVHGRNGIKNNGVGASSRVHFGKRYNNAFWSDSCFCMTYGDGDGTSWNPFASLDVAGHEMTHGVTSATANLIYSGESGGLNEAMSDIFGTCVEFYADNPDDPGDYLIGEEVYKAGAALRYMYNPSLDGRSRNCYSSDLGSIDVHYSSGVANHFFYLLAEGSSPRSGSGLPASPTCNGSAVVGIGRDAAAKIVYRALTVYMVSSTNYAGARAATLSAAKDLYGEGSKEHSATAAAWSAVKVN